MDHMDIVKPSYIEGQGMKIGYFYEYCPEAIDFEDLKEVIPYCVNECIRGVMEIADHMKSQHSILDQEQTDYTLTVHHKPSKNITWVSTICYEKKVD